MEAEPPASALPEPFRHDPLPDSTTHIRLLEILEGGFRAHIVCRLTAWLLESAPLYYALSYAWGDPLSTTTITVNGKESEITRNGEYALQQAFASKQAQYFWIDAVCIDQKGDKEKNHQVAMMGEIYSKARHVFACVGPHDENSKQLFSLMTKMQSVLTKLHPSINIGKSYFKKEDEWPKNCSFSPRMRKLQKEYLDTTKPTSRRLLLGKQFIQFMRRPYFSRLWILQELYLASQLSICCGADLRNPLDLIAVKCLFANWIFEHFINREAMFESLFPWKGLHNDMETIRPAFGCLILSSFQEPSTLQSMLETAMQHFHCSDARDKLYGIISIVSWPDESRPVPDYAKDSFEVAGDLIRCLLAQSLEFPFNRICLVLKAFEISPRLNALRKAVQARCALSKEMEIVGVGCCSYEIWKDDPPPAMWRSNLNRCIAIPLSSVLARDGYVQKGLYCTKPKNDGSESITKIFDHTGILMAYAPMETEAGDWLVAYYHEQRDSEDNLYLRINPLAMVFRNTEAAGRLVPLGQVSIDAEMLEGFLPEISYREFVIRWHAEDLLLLSWALFSRPSFSLNDEVDPERLGPWLNLGICATEGSSYATPAVRSGRWWRQHDIVMVV